MLLATPNNSSPNGFSAETLAFLPSLLATEIRWRRPGFSLDNCQAILRRGGHIGSAVIHHVSLPRAMTEAQRLITAAEYNSQGAASGFFVVADQLSEARGRFRRLWYAPPGGLWGCLALANTMLLPSRSLLPLAVGVAATETVRVFTPTSALTSTSLRWVNDVLLDGRKVAGFLIQTFLTPRYHDEFDLIGLAFNLNNRDFPSELHDSATSLVAAFGQEISLPYFLAVFLVKLRWNIGLLLHEEERLLAAEGIGRHRLLAVWRSLSDTVGRRLRYGFDVLSNPQYEATAIGIDEDGGLVLEHADGWRRTEYSGEVRYLD